jgi:hypothetical protein
VGGSNTEGVAATAARSDHVHAIAAGTPVSIGGSNSAGAATTFARADHVHRMLEVTPVPPDPPATGGTGALAGQVLLINASSPVTVELQNPGSCLNREIVLKEVSGGVATIDVSADGGANVEGVATYSFSGALSYRRFVSTGDSWALIG